ncbi:PocR ligand-binding domain-containing protein [Paratractidigestivibacter sp.]|uniref:PocR ligand-binding domain-containing protein n=1 Tax=Paratractidigestivibacter sp. TaxID=2847316 RepID=UPI002ABDEBB6|nr:PocR ligand-binding domain-containing protein [Paratractidigestivibacter sp.]
MGDDKQATGGTKGIADYIDIDRLQEIQDVASRALGVALIIADYRGVPITKMSGFTRHCTLSRENKDLALMCERCDAFGGIRAATSGEPCIYRCHAGLVDFAVPLVVDGNYLGAVLGGQVKLKEGAPALEDVVPKGTSIVSSPEMLTARDSIAPISYDRLKAAAETVRQLMGNIVGGSVGDPERLTQAIKDRDSELVVMQAALDEQQREQHKARQQARRLEEVFRCFFPVMNELHSLASSEKADQTDNLVLDFVDVSRYIMETDCRIVSLGEEVSHAYALLRVLSARYPDAIKSTVKVPERLYSTACPFMTLRPIILASLQDPWGEAPEGGCELNICVEESPGHLDVIVSQTCLSLGQMREAATEHGDGSSFTIRDASRHLGAMEEGNPGILVEPRSDGKAGCLARFVLPLNDTSRTRSARG